jgi:hypothetical protein
MQQNKEKETIYKNEICMCNVFSSVSLGKYVQTHL